MGLNAQARDQVPAHPPMRSPGSLLLEKWRRSDHEWTREVTHLVRRVRFAAIPLAMLAQETSRTTVTAGFRDQWSRMDMR